jgi:N-acetyl-anhydromuramyl-L-alanine amidase AmpD
LRQYLTIFGYDAIGGVQFDEKLDEIVTAFQRHYVPQKLGEPFDGEAMAILKALLKRVEA